ncbi:MAG: hypothetical protein EXR47_03070 [Dehalococcoidia bacterium]|nr:hypothetical protein [Dehalococcoidia bacterium]
MKLKLALGLMVTAIAVLAMACGGDKEPAATQPVAANKGATTPAPAAPAATTPAPVAPAPSMPSATAVTVKLMEGPYSFDPKKIEVTGGQVIKLVAGKEFHTFTVKDLGIDQIMAAGANAEVKVPMGKKGTFKLVCLPHESLGMVGEIVVK